MKLIIEKSATVITPSTLSSKLIDAIESVSEQTHSNLRHLVVVDGMEHHSKMPRLSKKNLDFLVLPYNTGANGFNGQRIYASMPHLVDTDFVFFLDEDNWYEPDHVASLIDTIESQKLDWAYSLRTIYSPDKKFIAHDNCESLGKWPIYFTHDNPQYLIDTSTFAFTRNFIKQVCHLWHSGPWGEDRRFLYSVKDHSKWNTSGKYSLCYRVDNNPQSVNGDFFINGNKEQLERYEGKLPWLNI